MVNPSNLILFQKKVGLFIVGSSNRYPENIARWKNLHYRQNDRELVVVTQIYRENNFETHLIGLQKKLKATWMLKLVK